MYEVLGISRAASEKDIKSAFRKQALKLHPDVNKSPGADKAFTACKEAYETLSDGERRREYDISLESSSRVRPCAPAALLCSSAGCMRACSPALASGRVLGQLAGGGRPGSMRPWASRPAGRICSGRPPTAACARRPPAARPRRRAHHQLHRTHQQHRHHHLLLQRR
jgi:curved DNA-binding protein CbpA